MNKPPLNFNFVNKSRRFYTLLFICLTLFMFITGITQQYEKDILNQLSILASIASAIYFVILWNIKMQKYKLAFESQKIYSFEELSSITGIKVSTITHDFRILLDYGDKDTEIMLDCLRYSIKPPKETDFNDHIERSFKSKSKSKMKTDKRNKAKLMFRRKVEALEKQRIAEMTNVQSESVSSESSTETCNPN